MSAIPFADAAERIKGAIDIIDVIQRHVILKKTGRSYTGKCPFHNDKSPSMNVSREKGIFKCFSCGVGGDALTFLMRIENRSYGEIIRELADEQGLVIQNDWGGQDSGAVAAARKDDRQRIFDLNAAACTWFQQQLAAPVQTSEEVRAYFERRYADEIDREEVESRFQLGFAPAGWENLTTFLKEKFEFIQANPDLLVNSGFSNSREHGQGHYDRFRNRFIIPIHDERGQVVAFGGRALSDEDKPKYLNSPETAVYKKNQVLYGFHQAKEAIRGSQSAVIMEGYFDVITAHLGGITEAVGSCGTAMTENHLKLLSRFGAQHVYLAFDSDEAGIKAALSAITMIEPYLETAELDIRVLIVPDGKDPDDYIRTHGGEAFRQLMTDARHHLAFKCDMAIRDLALKTPEGRIQAASRLTPLLTAIHRPTMQAEYVQRYADRTGLAAETLLLEIKRHTQNQQTVTRPQWGNNVHPFESKKAISKQGSTSFKGQNKTATPPPLMENMTALRAALPSRQAVLERSLLQLAVYNSVSFSVMMKLLDFNVRLLFVDAQHLEILDGLMALQPIVSDESARMTEDPAGTLIEKMNHLYLDKPDILHRFVELAITAESFGDSMGLGDLQDAVFQQKISEIANQQLLQLTQCYKKQQLLTIQSSARSQDGDEGQEIALTYEFKDRMDTYLPPNETSTSV